MPGPGVTKAAADCARACPALCAFAAAPARGALLDRVRGGQVSELRVAARKLRAGIHALPPRGLRPSHQTTLPPRGWFRWSVICREEVTEAVYSQEGCFLESALEMFILDDCYFSFCTAT